MSWLKRIHPITLHQSSNIPFVILEDGVRLCFSNMYDEGSDLSDHSIVFQANRKDLIRISTNYFRFVDFPITVPFESVVSCDDVIINGRVVKHATASISDPKNVVIAKAACLDVEDDDLFQNLVDIFDSADRSFVLVEEEVNPQIRLLEDIADTIHHQGDWGRTCVAVADAMALGHRKYCWTHSVPDLNVSCYGLEDDDMEKIQNFFDFIGLNCAVTWDD